MPPIRKTTELFPPAAATGRARRLSLRSKVALVTIGSGALVAAMLVVAFFVQARDAMTAELRARGQAVAIGLASNLSYATFSNDTEGLSRVIRATLAEVPDMAYVVVRDAGGKPLAVAIQPELKELKLSAEDVPSQPPARGARTADRLVSLRGTSLLAVEAPVLLEQKSFTLTEEDLLGPMALVERTASRVSENKSLGAIQIGLRLDSLQAKISTITSRALGLGLLAMVGCALVAFLLARLVTEPVERLTRAATGIARGDLEQSIRAAGTDEISELAWSFETMTSGLKQMIADLRAASSDVEREAARILSTSSQQTVVASQQSAYMNETRSTANEIARASKTATGVADSVIQTAQKSEEVAAEGQRIVQESVSGIERLGSQVMLLGEEIEALAGRTRKIVEIIGTVKEVAEMSHVLSLNLSIQAAHAGANRRGFDVVATEMRKLASLSGVAATEVRAIVEEIQEGMHAALAAAREGTRSALDTVFLSQMAGKTISGLANVIHQSSRAAREIADHTRRQTTGIEQILEAISEQSQAMLAAVQGSEQVEDVAENLTTLARRLSGMVSRYSVSRKPAAGEGR